MPRREENSGILTVRIKRKLNMVNHHEKGSLRPEIMFRGLEYLKKNHFSYRNIIIENYDEWINHHNETDSPYEDQRYTFILV